MDYHLPILGEFTARAFIGHPDAWPRFIGMLRRKGKARIAVSSVLEQEGKTVGSRSRELVALAANAG